MKQRLMRSLADLIILVVAASGAFAAYAVVAQDVRMVRVISDSMAPKFHRGDILIVKPEQTRKLSVGEIAVLPLLDGSGGYYIHRIVKVAQAENGAITITTKGDANPIADRWQLDITSQKVPTYLAQIPMSVIPIFKASNGVIATLSLLFLLIAISLFIPRKSASITT